MLVLPAATCAQVIGDYFFTRPDILPVLVLSLEKVLSVEFNSERSTAKYRTRRESVGASFKRPTVPE